MQPLTREQMQDALDQLHTHCELIVQQNELGYTEYQYLSVRESLNTLGFHGQDQDQIMDAIHAHGFTYCFDTQYKCSDGVGGNGEMIYPSHAACSWTPEQLKSRLPRTFWKEAIR